MAPSSSAIRFTLRLNSGRSSAPLPRLPSGFCGGSDATITAMPRRCASPIILSSAPMTPEIGCFIAEVVGAVHEQQQLWLVAVQHAGQPLTPPAQWRDGALANSPEQPSLNTSIAWSVYRADSNA